MLNILELSTHWSENVECYGGQKLQADC